MGEIVRLDDQLSNKIAAGEVVERPASIVKELAENAVDAGSSRIEIDVEEGGLSKIKVIDDGSGIGKEDCALAFHRHATSKIKNERDLFHIRSLGFRGEALPSIASVCHLEIKTGTGKGPGTHLVLEGGTVIEEKLSASRRGTEVVVTKLFFNTPARLKHLKTVHTELGNITDAVYRMALAHPDVSFKLTHNGKKTFRTNGNGDLRQVIAAIYGMNTAKKMVSVRGESLDFSVSGWVAKPEVTRASRQHMMIFMNGRYIRNYAVTRAVLGAYHTLLPIRRYPIAVIRIDMDPTLIDVNVHPSKLEARLSKEKELCRLVEKTVKDALRTLRLIPEVTVPKQRSRSSEQQQFRFDRQPKPADFSATTSPKEPRSQNHPAEEPLSVREQPASPGYHTGPEEQPTASSEVKPDSGETAGEPDGHEPDEPDKEPRVPPLYPIGQVQGTYILAQNEEGLYIIDQHAAQERIKYEYYREKVGRVPQEVQELLVPLTFEFSNAEAAVIEEHIDQLEKVGVFLEPFGQGTFIVRSHPQWFPKGFEKETVEDIVFQVIEDEKADVAKLREDAAILMSCKRSIKANHRLRNDEMVALLERLRETKDPFTCPHGRPIIIHFTIYDMEKMFKRVM